MHIKHIHDMIEKLSECAKCEMDKGIEQLDTKEMGEVAEIIKELSEAEYYAKISKAMDESEYGEDYDEYGPIDDGRRGYRGQPRSESGRFMSRGDGRRSNRGRGGRRGYEEPIYRMSVEDYKMHEPEYWRDLDRVAGRMYFTDGNMSTDGNTSTNNMGSGSTRGYSENNGGQYSSRMQREGMNESRYDRAKRGYEESKAMHKSGSVEDKKKNMESLEHYMKELSEEMAELIESMDASEKTMVRSKLQTLAQKVQ